jgi:hypothetical protein
LVRAAFVSIVCVALASCLAASAPSRRVPVDPFALTKEQSDYYYLVAGQARTDYRNELIAARMYEVDLNYTQFEGALMRERQGIGFLGTTANLGLTGAVPLVDGTQTKNILGAAASFITGTRAAYYDEVLQKVTVQIIINQMRANRDMTKEKILRKWSQPTTTYPIASALSDVEAYYRAGTLVSGVVEATETVGEKAAIVERSKDFVEINGIAVDAAYYSLESFLYEGGSQLSKVREQQLRNILKKTHPSLLLTDVLQDPDKAAIRTELLAEINKVQ